MRVSKNEYFTEMAKLVSTQATCARRQVGCVLVNKRNHVIATGYNGNAAGQPHCIEVKCPGADLPSGQGLDQCQAIHAEANALLQCKDVYEIAKAYVTASPCIHCVKLLLNTGCEEIIFIDEYPHWEARHMWRDAGRKWTKFESDAEIQARLDANGDDIPF